MQLTSSLFTSKPLRPLPLNYKHYLGFCKPGVGLTGATQALPWPSGHLSRRLLTELPGRAQQTVYRGSGQCRDILRGKIARDGCIEEDIALGRKFLITAPENVGNRHPGKGQK